MSPDMSNSQTFSFDSLYAQNTPPPAALGRGRRARYDFAVAYPDPATIPTAGLLESLHGALEEEGHDLALYAHPQGYTPLREYVAAKLGRDRNIQVTAEDIILGDGSSQPIHMVLETLIEPGDVILTEDFVYSGTLRQMHRFRADLRGIACDEEGMLPDAIEAALRQARHEGKPVKLIYTVPTFQNPQGWTMSLHRREALVALAQQYGVPILEDDCYVDLRFEGQDVTSLHALDDSGLVLYVASFSKIIAPGMRLGYLTGPREFLGKALAVKSGGSVNSFAAYAVHRFSTGQLHGHIEEINDIQREKRDAMLAALDEHFGAAASWSKPQGGLFIWLELPHQAGATPDTAVDATVDATSVRDKILETDDVGYIPGPAFAADGTSGRNCLRLCFGYNTPAEIGEGIARLAQAFRREGLLP